MITHYEPAVLDLDGVAKRFGSGATEVRALTDVSLQVQPGEFVAVMGPSGSGKSTLLHLAGGLDAPDAGRILVAGRDVGAMGLSERSALRRQRVGYVFQRLNLVPTLTALENVVLPLELDGMSQRPARRLATAALESVGITEQLDRYPDDFSGGQQQRIAVARGIVGERDLLLADEPTGALDTLTGDGVIELLADLAESRGTAVVLVTHEPRYASWADRVVFLRDGRIVDEADGGSDSSDGNAETGPEPDAPATESTTGEPLVVKL